MEEVEEKEEEEGVEEKIKLKNEKFRIMAAHCLFASGCWLDYSEGSNQSAW